MEIVIGTDKNDMGRKAADAAAAKICAAIAARGGARVVFASAASQFEFLEALLAHREIDWSKVHGFHLDEYVGLPADHPASFRRFLRERLLAKLPCAPAGFTFVGGDAPDPAAECARLEAAIRCRRQQVGEGWYPNLDAVPTHAYSMTVPQILAARSIVCVVPDARKADAVAAAVDGPLTPLCPSSILRTHPDCTLYLDPAAAAKLKQ